MEAGRQAGRRVGVGAERNGMAGTISGSNGPGSNGSGSNGHPGPPRVGVIGCGHWGRNIVRTVQALGALRAVADPSEAGRAQARTLAPDAAIFDDAEALLAGADLDAIMIATPAETHYALARRAIDGGLDVFVEKPMTICVDEARDLVARADDAGRVLMVGHLLEYHPAVLRLARLIRDGELGSVRYLISNRLNLGKIRTEENALWSFAPHDIAVILRLTGDMPIEIVATGGSYITPNIADVTITQMLFSSGVRAHIFVSWLHPFKEQKLIVIGSARMAVFDDVAKELVLYDQRVDWQAGQPVPVRGEGQIVPFDSDEPLREECSHFLACVADRCRPRTCGRSGLSVLEILHAAQRSLMTNGHPVQMPSAAPASRGRPAPPRGGAPLTETVRPAARPAHARL